MQWKDASGKHVSNTINELGFDQETLKPTNELVL
jgi:hypothetical protein